MREVIFFEKVKRYLIIIFIFLLPFDYYDFFGGSSFVSLSKLVGGFYFIWSLLWLKRSFKIKEIKKYLIPLLLLWLLLSLQTMFHYNSASRFPVLDFTVLFGIILFWMLFNDLISKVISLKMVLFSIVMSIFLVSLLVPFGIGIETAMDDLGIIRLEFFGMNSNNLGTFCNLGIITSLSMALDPKKFFGKKTVLLLLTIPGLLVLIGFSGSRSAVVIAILSFIVSTLVVKTKLFTKLLITIVAVFVIFLSYSKMMESEVMSRRIEKTIEQSEVGEREEIWGIAFDLFLEKPILGWSNIGYEKQMKIRHSRFKDTHNLFLYIMVCTGIVGLILFLIFLKNMMKSIYLHYNKGLMVIMPLLLLVYLSNISKSGGVIGSKSMWLIAAIMCSSGYLVMHRKKNLNE